MPAYLPSINQKIVSVVSSIPRISLYGQNINTGTMISGLTKGLKAHPTGRIINVPNCENTLCGMGFGLMLSGLPGVYFVKQQDFMLLGIDHFVNTYNFIRCSLAPDSLGSFSIIMLVCDQGMQGPQSSFNNMGDFCSIARIPCYTLTNNQDAEYVIGRILPSPGFRMIGLSSRLAKTDFLDFELVYRANDGSLFQYSDGEDATIVCFNFSLYEGNLLRSRLAEKGKSSALFSINYLPNIDWAPVIKSVSKTRKLVIMDDSKSAHLPAYKIFRTLNESGIAYKHILLTREEDIDYGLSPDRFKVDIDALVNDLTGGKI